MPRLPRWTAAEAGFVMLRAKGSHRMYWKGTRRVVVPFHGGVVLHPKIVKQVIEAIEEAT